MCSSWPLDQFGTVSLVCVCACVASGSSEMTQQQAHSVQWMDYSQLLTEADATGELSLGE